MLNEHFWSLICLPCFDRLVQASWEMTEFLGAQSYLRVDGITGHAETVLLLNCLGRTVLVAEVIEQVSARQLGALLDTSSSALAGVALAIRRGLASSNLSNQATSAQ